MFIILIIAVLVITISLTTKRRCDMHKDCGEKNRRDVIYKTCTVGTNTGRESSPNTK